MTVIDRELSRLDQHVIGRTTSFFHDDLEARSDELSALVRGSRILLIGGAGSIGYNTLRTIVPYGPSTVHVIDHNENGLAELIRSLRSSSDLGPLPEIQALPFDFGGDPFRLWLSNQPVDYDFVLNFAALKHVRSEKDPFSILAMLETNVLHLDRLSQLLERQRRLSRVFSVSTDKAANPSSMMGATKRLMEHALFRPTVPWGAATAVASARFANVAFSNGSLLHGWQQRLSAHQPLACPVDCRRFFVSLDESGHLCTLAGFLGADRTLTVPALDPGQHLVLLTDVMTKFLEFHGYEPAPTHDPDEAVGRVDELRTAGKWPVLLTPLDTGGEKPYEEFVGAHERLRPARFSTLREIDYLEPSDAASFPALVEAIGELLRGPTGADVTSDRIKEVISRVEPAFAESHRASTKSLDERI